MSRPNALLLLLVALVTAMPARAQQPPPPPSGPPLKISTTSLPRAATQLPYDVRLEAEDGTAPLRWRLGGDTVPGLVLDPEHGRLHGTPTAAGEFRITLSVADSGTPPQVASRTLVLQVAPPLELVWEQKPSAQADQIKGSVEISNNTAGEFDLTLIVVAVNEVGKAFALGYEHGPMPGQTERRSFTFGALINLPRGHYVVHVDAVAELPARNAIFRARLQTPGALAIP